MIKITFDQVTRTATVETDYHVLEMVDVDLAFELDKPVPDVEAMETALRGQLKEPRRRHINFTGLIREES